MLPANVSDDGTSILAFFRIGLGAFAILATRRFARTFAGPQAQEN